MKAAIMAVGSELLGTTRLDTNSLKIAAALERYGVELTKKSVIGDDRAAIAREISAVLVDHDLLVTSGGLGPTEDDMTKEAMSDALGLQLESDPNILLAMEALFAKRGWAMPNSNRKQALVFRAPDQITLMNERGTAPGFHLTKDGKHIWIFPGVPSELEWMMSTYFVPWLQETMPNVQRFRRTLRIAGMPESLVDEKVKPFYDRHRDHPTTILASGGEISLNLLVTGEEEEANKRLALMEVELREILGDRIFGTGDDTLEGVVGRMLTERGETIATAESCTGGLLSSRITDVPGSSNYFVGGVISYAGTVKIRELGVPAELIAAHGEVSEEVARAMASGVRQKLRTTYGVGVTGIAGPDGGTPEKPVGLVHLAVASPEGIEHRKVMYRGTRETIKRLSTQVALDLIRVVIMRRGPGGN